MADRATRSLAPGGSFICPNTRHGMVEDRVVGRRNLGPLHFEPQVVAFAGPLADAGEDRVPAVLRGDAGDQLLDDDRLADAGPAEQTGLAAADERAQQVDDLDARLEHLALVRSDRRAGAGRDGSTWWSWR